MTDAAARSRAWVLLVTGGTVIEYAPELYIDRARAEEEAERWAWILSGAGWADVERSFPGRWEVAERSVRLVEVTAEHVHHFTGCWIGTFWDHNGTPEPEALILPDELAALEWVREPPNGSGPPVALEHRLWFVAATYLHSDEEEYAVAHRAKLVT